MTLAGGRVIKWRLKLRCSVSFGNKKEKIAAANRAPPLLQIVGKQALVCISLKKKKSCQKQSVT
jgi:hypothetical protein